MTTLIRHRRGRGALVAILLFFASACSKTQPSSEPVTAPVVTKPEKVVEATSEQVHAFCGSCHFYPPADSFPRHDWRKEVEQGYRFYTMPSPASLKVHRDGIFVPSVDSVVKYYEKRAPEKLDLPDPQNLTTRCPVNFKRTECPIPGQLESPAVSNVNLVHLTDDKKLDLLACDMRQGRVMLMKPYEKNPHWQVLATLHNPCHTAVVDLDGDGIKDILVADLGNYTPTDERLGSVVWLRGRPDGTYQPITLLDGLGRVADVEAAHFRNNKQLDLVVAEFGWQLAGSILLLENKTTDWSHPKFEPHVVDPRHGSIHVPVCDLNGDGKPDFVAVISQEYETVVAFINQGNGKFEKKVIYTAPHPAYGSTGIQLVDLDGDGKLDVLYTNGDILDQPFLLKPYHSIRWLRNTGKFPFKDIKLTEMCGVHRAVAADFRGNGKLDIMAVSFLPGSVFPERKEKNLDSVIYLEQTSPGKFVRRSLEKITCDHATCVAGAWDGDGRVHFATGNFCLNLTDKNPISVTLWKNVGVKETDLSRR